MKNLSTFIIGIIFILNTSCSDVLETTPESTITVNSFWKSEQDAIGGLYGMYNQFRDFANGNLILFGESRSEIMGHGTANASFRIKYFENTLTETNADLSWQQLYRIINYANLIIKYVPHIDFVNESEQDDIVAQAYAMRAYTYFVMAKTWGNLPIFTEPVEGYSAEATFKKRSAVEEVFNLIKSDVDQANNLFTDFEFNSSRSIWNKAAVNMLKAEVYLTTGKMFGGGDSDLSTALSALQSAESANLELLDDYASIFDYDNKGNNEVILAVNFKDLEASDNYFADMYIGTSGIGSLDEESRSNVGAPSSRTNYWAPTPTIRDQFNEEDQRKDASFLEIYTSVGGKKSFFTSIVMKGNGFVEGGVRNFLDDIIIYRYADLLLMKAEAKNALGQDPSEEINQIRKRAYGDNFPEYEFTSLSQQENNEIILQERLFEFAFEAKRWWDLVRFGKAFELVPSLEGRESEGHLLLWPVPMSTLSLNSKLVQTSGY